MLVIGIFSFVFNLFEEFNRILGFVEVTITLPDIFPVYPFFVYLIIIFFFSQLEYNSHKSKTFQFTQLSTLRVPGTMTDMC